MGEVINLIPVTDRCKSWLLDNMTTELWKLTYVKYGCLPFSENLIEKLVKEMLDSGLDENDFILAKEE